MDISAQFKHTLVLLFTTVLLLIGIQAENVTYCDETRHYIVNVQNFEISPSPVQAGRPASFKIYASTSQPITAGKVVIGVSFLGLHVHTETRHLCEETSCPIAVGNFVLSHTQSLPAITPPGSYTLQLEMQDENNLQLTCFSIQFKITLGDFWAAGWMN